MTPHSGRIQSNATLQRAAELVAMSRVTDLMVVDEQNNFVGVLSEGDILRAALPDSNQILQVFTAGFGAAEHFGLRLLSHSTGTAG